MIEESEESESEAEVEEVWMKIEGRWGGRGSLELIRKIESALPLREIVRPSLTQLYPEIEYQRPYRHWLQVARMQTSERCYFWPWMTTPNPWPLLTNAQTEQFLENYVSSQIFPLQKSVARHFLLHGYSPNSWLQDNHDGLSLQTYHECLVGMAQLSYRCLQYYLRKNGRRTMSYRSSSETSAMRAALINGQHWLHPKDWLLLAAIIRHAHQLENCTAEPNSLFQLRIALIQEYKYARKDESIALRHLRTHEEGWLQHVQQKLLQMLVERRTIPQICLQLLMTFPQYPALGDRDTVRKFTCGLMKQQLVRLQRGEIWKQFRVDLRINSYQIKCIACAPESSGIRSLLSWTALHPEDYGATARTVIPLLKKYLTSISRF